MPDLQPVVIDHPLSTLSEAEIDARAAQAALRRRRAASRSVRPATSSIPAPPARRATEPPVVGSAPPPAAGGVGLGLPVTGVPATVAQSDTRDVPIWLSGIGSIVSLNVVTVKPRVDGQLTRVLFTEGQEVHAGDVLATIDSRQYQAALDQAMAVISEARRDAHRAPRSRRSISARRRSSGVVILKFSTGAGNTATVPP